MRPLVVIAATALLAGCGGKASSERAAPGGNVSASCAAVVVYGGETYAGSAAKVAPTPGRPLGSATVPPCNDTPGSNDQTAEDVEVSEIDGVPTDVAIMRDGQEEAVYIRRELIGREKLPAELERLLHGVECNATDEPIALSGPWRGILSADGTTERDLVTPYDVEMRVADSSSPRYARAYLSVRVPAELDRPLSRSDVESSLWNGGTIDVTARCEGGRFVAARIQAHPPR